MHLNLQKPKEKHWQTFFIALGTAAIFFLPFVIRDNGYFLFYGDFNVQQIPFYQMCHDMVKSGNIFWNWETDLGVNFVGSYSFYLLGSPFFWITLLFPNAAVPYLIAPLLVLKFAFSALTAYLYIRRFTRRPETASIAALLYAFSGFSVYNIFFNHFHEAIVFFPLLLWALEVFITENRRGVLALTLCICAVSNYFFFCGMVVFVVIYWFVRMLSGCWKMTVRSFLALALEILLGVLLGAVILLPSLLAVIQNSRISSISYGWNAIMYGKEQIYPNIFQCFFFPPDIPARPVFFPDADVKWASLGGWLPIFSMVGVVAWFQSKRGHWLRRIIGILIFMAMIPILNSAFYMFNSAYYARWFYMPVLMMCLATAMAFENRDVDLKKGFRWTAAITIGITLVIGLFPSEIVDGAITKIGLYTADSEGSNLYFLRFWITAGIAFVGLVLLRILMTLLKRNQKLFYRMAIIAICGVTVVYAGFFIYSGKSHAFGTDDVMIPQLLEGDVDLPGNSDNYRIDVYSAVDNTGMYLGIPCINSFHSIVPASVTQFYEYIGEDRGVASRPTTDSYAIRSLLSVRFLLSRNNGDSFVDDDGDTLMPGWTLYNSDISGYSVYKNENYVPYGFTYDYYMTKEQCEYYGTDYTSNMMLKAILLSDKQIERNKDILKNIAEDYIVGTDSDYFSEGMKTRDNIYFDDETFAEDCDKLAATSATAFTRDNGGFTATINLDSENLVFFSVPYESGWTATVNGVAAKIEKVNAGFMAVRAPNGTTTIRFDYMTPGLSMGILITGITAIVFIIYLLIFALYKKNNPNLAKISYPEGEALNKQWMEYDRIEAFERTVSLLEENNKENIDNLDDELSVPPIDFEDMNISDGFNVDLSAGDASYDDINYNSTDFKVSDLTDIPIWPHPPEKNDINGYNSDNDENNNTDNGGLE